MSFVNKLEGHSYHGYHCFYMTIIAIMHNFHSYCMTIKDIMAIKADRAELTWLAVLKTSAQLECLKMLSQLTY